MLWWCPVVAIEDGTKPIFKENAMSHLARRLFAKTMTRLIGQLPNAGPLFAWTRTAHDDEFHFTLVIDVRMSST